MPPVERRKKKKKKKGDRGAGRKRQGQADMKEWPVGMKESCEDVSGSCLRINPTVSSQKEESTNTSRPAAELLVQLKGNIIKMQMWPIY